MRQIALIGLAIMLFVGCSVTVINYERPRPYDDYDNHEWDWEWGEDDENPTHSTKVDDDETESARASNHEIREHLLSELKGMIPILSERYKDELREKPDLKGTIVLRLIVSQDGLIKSATTISNTTNNDRFAEALKRELVGVKLPSGVASSADTAFDIPFSFNPKTGVEMQ